MGGDITGKRAAEILFGRVYSKQAVALGDILLGNGTYSTHPIPAGESPLLTGSRGGTQRIVAAAPISESPHSTGDAL